MKQHKKLKVNPRPIPVDPWFFKYLKGAELNMVGAIIAHANYKDRIGNSFASNFKLAFHAGIGNIDHDEFNLLKDDKKKAYKKKKIKNAIRSVKAIKQRLEEKGVITREYKDTKSYAIMNLDWGKERYYREFEEYFNDEIEEQKTNKDDIKDKLNQLTKLANEGNISNDNLAKQLEDLTNNLTNNKSNNNTNIPDEDIDLVATHIMETEKVQKKIISRDIPNPAGYITTIKRLIKDNQYNGIDTFYKDMLFKETYMIEQTLKHYLSQNAKEQIENGEKHFYKLVSFDRKYNVFYVLFSNIDQSSIISRTVPQALMTELFLNKNIKYSTKAKTMFEEYQINNNKYSKEQIETKRNNKKDSSNDPPTKELTDEEKENSTDDIPF